MSGESRDTDRDWKRVAREDPFWGVLSQDEYRKGEMDDARLAQFMATGELFVDNLLALVRKHLAPGFAPKRAFDFGCGVGRLLIPLSRHVEQAVGADVAPAMLTLCARHAKKAGAENITLVQSDDALGGVEGSFDLVNTYIVLQHIPPSRGYRLIQALIDRLETGGVGSIQVTYAKSREYLVHEAPRALYYRRDGDTIVDLLEGDWSPPEGTINMYDYDLNEVMARIARHAGHPVVVLPTGDDGHLGTHFVFQKAR